MEENKEPQNQPIPVLRCPHNNMARLLCCSQQCYLTSALICRHDECKCLPQAHTTCQMIYTDNFISAVMSKKKPLTPIIQKALQQVDKVYWEAIEKLSKDRDSLCKWKENYGLNEKEAVFLELVQMSKIEEITGKLVNEVKQEVIFQYEHSWLNQQWVQDFWKKKKTNFHQLFKGVDDIMNSYTSQSRFQSKILSDSQSNSVIRFFNVKVKSIRLLYRASANNFSRRSWMQKCEGIPNTITLVRTSNNKTIGAFTPTPWISTKSNQAVPFYDPTNKSFVFSVNMKQKFPIKNKGIAGVHCDLYGPAFSGVELKRQNVFADRNAMYASDFQIGGPGSYGQKISDQIKQGRFVFPMQNYICEDQDIISKEKLQEEFIGHSSGTFIAIAEWEVFEIKF